MSCFGFLLFVFGDLKPMELEFKTSNAFFCGHCVVDFDHFAAWIFVVKLTCPLLTKPDQQFGASKSWFLPHEFVYVCISFAEKHGF